MVYNSRVHNDQLSYDRPNPIVHDRNISFFCKTNEFQLIRKFENEYFSIYFDCLAIRYGIEPNIRSIIAKCSLLSCVLKKKIQ